MSARPPVLFPESKLEVDGNLGDAPARQRGNLILRLDFYRNSYSRALPAIVMLI